MSDIDNPEVEATAAATEGQVQDNLLTGQQTSAETSAENTAQETANDWRASLPDDLKSAKSLQSIKSVEDLAKGFVNAQSVIGRRFEDLTPEQVKEYYSTLGTPESPDGYELKAPEGAQVNPELESWYKEKAHEYGIPKESAEKLFNDYIELENSQLGEMQQLSELKAQENIEQLKKDFGPAFDERVTLANRALKEFGGDEAVQAINELGLGSHPTLVKLLANAGETLSEGKFTSGSSTGKFGMTSEEASSQIDTLRRDPEFMKHYADSTSPKNAEARKKLEGLYQIKVNATG